MITQNHWSMKQWRFESKQKNIKGQILFSFNYYSGFLFSIFIRVVWNKTVKIDSTIKNEVFGQICQVIILTIFFFGLMSNCLRFKWELVINEVWNNENPRTNETNIKGQKLFSFNFYSGSLHKMYGTEFGRIDSTINKWSVWSNM